MTDPIQTLWAGAEGDARPPSTDVLRDRARTLRRRTRIRDTVEYASGLIGVGVFVLYGTVAANALVAAGCALTIAGTLAVMVGLWRRRLRRAPDDAAAASAGYLRDLLVRQRDMLASIGRWYLAPVVPGMLVFLAGRWVDLAARRDAASATVVIGAALAVIGLVGALVLWANHRAARALTADIVALDRTTLPS